MRRSLTEHDKVVLAMYHEYQDIDEIIRNIGVCDAGEKLCDRIDSLSDNLTDEIIHGDGEISKEIGKSSDWRRRVF